VARWLEVGDDLEMYPIIDCCVRTLVGLSKDRSAIQPLSQQAAPALEKMRDSIFVSKLRAGTKVRLITACF